MSPVESLNYFILGFIEDVLSTKTESGILPEEAPGAQNLRNIFKLSDDQFKLIRTFIKETISKVGVVQDPQEALNRIEKSGAKTKMEKVARGFSPTIQPNTYSIDDIPGNWARRIFVGGDYVNYYYVINMLNLLVSNNGFTPIIASEFIKPPEMSIREHALLLLHNCKYAIFDISGRGGHLMEIERIFDYQTKAYYVCLEGQQPTAMLDYLKESVLYFKEIDIDLQQKVNTLLSSIAK